LSGNKVFRKKVLGLSLRVKLQGLLSLAGFEVDFGEVLSSAWKTIWKHKVLWSFGILASCRRADDVTGNLGNSVNWTMPASN
jgi:hypothetical protein